MPHIPYQPRQLAPTANPAAGPPPPLPAATAPVPPDAMPAPEFLAGIPRRRTREPLDQANTDAARSLRLPRISLHNHRVDPEQIARDLGLGPPDQTG